MNSASAFLLLFFFIIDTTTAVMVEDPPRPRVSETFTTSFFSQSILKYKDTNNFSMEETNGYIVKDMKGGRQLQNYTKSINGTLMYAFSRLDRMDTNTTFVTFWDASSDNTTCHKMIGAWIPMMWDWLQNTSYEGQIYFNMDEWLYNDEPWSTTLIGVSVKNPNVPLQILHVDNTYHISTMEIFYGFDPMYEPTDSDFNIPPNCNAFEKSAPNQYHDMFEIFGDVMKSSQYGKTKNNYLKKKQGFSW